MSHKLEPPQATEELPYAATQAATPIPGGRRSAGGFQTWWHWIVFPCSLFVCTRIALLGVSAMGLFVVPELWSHRQPHPFLGRFPALDGLCRWDCGYYERIAQTGYTEPLLTNFFPLYPLLARALHEVSQIHLAFALLIIPNVAGFGAFLVIYRIFATLSGENAARWGLVLLAAYPFAFFQATAYPEALMMFFSALAVLLALRGHHIWAGVALGLGGLARHLALVAGTSLLAAQLRQRGFHLQRFVLSTAVVGLLVPWLFLGVYCLYQYVVFGDALAFLHVRVAWGPQAWWGLTDLLTTNDRTIGVRLMYTYLPFALIPTLGALALGTRREWVELAPFGLMLMVVLWSVGMVAFGRYSASCWPAFLPLGAYLAQRPNLQGPIVGVLALCQGLFFYLFVHRFPVF